MIWKNYQVIWNVDRSLNTWVYVFLEKLQSCVQMQEYQANIKIACPSKM